LDEATLVSTNALDFDGATWGMARLNVHGNVPLSISETGITYMLIGDASIENMVTDAFTPAAPVTMQALVGANLRSIPSTDGRVVASAPAGAALTASGLSADGQWAYVTIDDTVAWVSLQIVIPTEGDLATLPTVTNDTRTNMQNFALTTGTESSECSEESPSMLLMQAPAGVSAIVEANGAPLRFTDTVVLRTLADNSLQAFVLSGSATAGVVSVPPGFTVSAPLNSAGLSTGSSWAGLRPMTADERGFLSILQQTPEATLYTAVAVPTQEEIAATLRSVNQAAGSAGTTVAATGGAGCSGFRPTSPLDGLAFGPTTFYWDGVGNASQYRVNVFTDGELAYSETIDALSTTTTFDTATAFIGDGTSYGWNVEAISNSQVTCTTGTVTLLREAAAQTAGSGGGGGGDNGGGGNDCGWGGCQ
ncbi:MAG: SH3 domain-containing protein, partial [Chloroflexota bacterium]